jgi:hypothetical protein
VEAGCSPSRTRILEHERGASHCPPNAGGICGGWDLRLHAAAAPSNRFFLMMAWMPQLPSTTWVTPNSTPTEMSALEVRRSAPAKPRLRAIRDRQGARPPPGHPHNSRGGSAVRSRAFGSEPSRRRGMLAQKIMTGRDFQRTGVMITLRPSVHPARKGRRVWVARHLALFSETISPRSGKLFSEHKQTIHWRGRIRLVGGR